MTASLHEIASCYRILLGREPAESELEFYYRAELPLQLMVRGFLNSDEFRKRFESMRLESIHGMEFFMPSADRMYQADYESHVFCPLMERMEAGVTLLDVGANIGVFSVHAAKRGAQAIAVEALAANARLLLDNARHNGVEVQLHPLAASDRHGYARLKVGETLNAIITEDEGMIVATAPLDALTDDRRIDVLKIDVEGHEYRAMCGAQRLLARCRPVIFTEYSPIMQQDCSGVTGTEYLALFSRLGYRALVLWRDADPEPVSFERIDDRWRASGISHVDLMLDPG